MPPNPTKTSNRDPKSRDNRIVCLRWLSIIGVVILHARFESRYSDSAVRVVEAFQWFSSWSVIAFFWISGRLWKLGAGWLENARKRVGRLIVPYLAVSFVSFVIFYGIIQAAIYRPADAATVTFGSLAAGIVTGNGFGPQMYFLPYLFLVGIAWDGLVRFVQPGIVLAFLFGLLLFQWGRCGECRLTGPGWNQLLLYSCAYGLGLVSKILSSKWQLLVLGGVVCGSIVLYGITGHVSSWLLIALLVPQVLYSGAALISISVKNVNRLEYFSPGVIYLWHAPVILPATSVLLHRAGVNDLSNFALTCVTGVMICLGIGEVLRKFRFGRWLSL